MQSIPKALAPGSIHETDSLRAALIADVEQRLASVQLAEERAVLEGLEIALSRKNLDFPPLPQPALRMLELWGNIETVRHSTVIGIVEADPALAGRIVKMANSPFYMVATPASSLRAAVIRIGLVEVRRVIMSEAFGKTFKAPGFEKELERIRQRSQVSGWLAVELAPALGLNPDDGFLAALLHDAGELAAYHMVQSCAQAGLWVRDQGLLLVGAGRELMIEMAARLHLGLGALFMDHWNLPPAIASAMAFHHHPDLAEEEHRELSRLVFGADQLSDTALAHFADVAWLEWLAEHDPHNPAEGPDDGVDSLQVAPVAQALRLPDGVLRKALRKVLMRISDD